MTRVAIVGFGSIGSRHARNLRAMGISDLVVCDPVATRREAAAATGARVCARLEDALEARPTAVFVTTPPASHVPIAREAAAASCHLFIEKPLSHTEEGLEELVEAIQRKRLVTLVGCNMRFHHGPATIKRLLDEATIGRVVAALLDAGQYLPDWHPTEDYRQGYSAQRVLGGGVVLDGIHELDYARWLFGRVRRVFAMGGRLSRLEIDTEDCANILLECASGTIAHVHLDYVQRVYGRSCKVIGEEGTIVWEMTSGPVRLYTASQRAWREMPAPEGYTVNEMYVEEMRHFLNCLRGIEQPMQDVREAAEAMRLALAAKASLDTGQPVDLDEPAAVRSA